MGHATTNTDQDFANIAAKARAATCDTWKLESHKDKSETGGEARLTTALICPNAIAEMIDGLALLDSREELSAASSPIIGFHGQWPRADSDQTGAPACRRSADSQNAPHQGWAPISREKEMHRPISAMRGRDPRNAGRNAWRNLASLGLVLDGHKQGFRNPFPLAARSIRPCVSSGQAPE